MWVFTSIGYYSVIEHRKDPKLLLVRARVKGDLEKFRDKYLSNLGEITITPTHDYPYRALAWKVEFAEAMKKIALDISYPNFKSEVSKKQGNHRHDLYMKVWSVMRDAENLMKQMAEDDKRWAARKREPVSVQKGGENSAFDWFPDRNESIFRAESTQDNNEISIGSTWTDGTEEVTLVNYWLKDQKWWVTYETELGTRIDRRFVDFKKVYRDAYAEVTAANAKHKSRKARETRLARKAQPLANELATAFDMEEDARDVLAEELEEARKVTEMALTDLRNINKGKSISSDCVVVHDAEKLTPEELDRLVEAQLRGTDADYDTPFEEG